VNPYLAVAGTIAAGLWGVERKLELTSAPIAGSAYMEGPKERLPRNLFDAANRLGESTIAREILGDGFVDHYVTTRLWEWKRFQEVVTDWELARYFEII